MSALFSPYQLGSLTLKNRITIAPMCQYSAQGGIASDWHLLHFGAMMLSGAGLFCIEATAVEPEGRITAADLGLWSDQTEAAIAKVLGSLRKYSDMPVAIQLAHAGRKASCMVPWEGGKQRSPAQSGWQTVAPSAIAHNGDDHPPLALNHTEIARLCQSFADAAVRAHNLGIDAIEIHAAHGYLLHQFLSPLANQRQDEYGGSLENRMRFPLQVFDAIRAALPADKIVGIRVSASDWVEGGWNIDDCLVFAQALQQRGCAFIHVSSGGVSPLQNIPATVGYQVGFAEQIRKTSGMPTIAVGLITQPEHAESIIATGQADMVALARGILYDPHWPWHAAAQLGASVQVPPQYLRSQPTDYKALLSPIQNLPA
jgi:2,4-dienoyl-CoA reductase-like NADH-dependent reductase (Old Yellow Enzyme family)